MKPLIRLKCDQVLIDKYEACRLSHPEIQAPSLTFHIKTGMLNNRDYELLTKECVETVTRWVEEVERL